MRRCNKCGLEKEFTYFAKCKSSNGGLSTICKMCRNTRSKELYKEKKEYIMNKMNKRRRADPEKYNAESKEFYHKNKEQISVKRIARRKANPDVYRNYWLKAKYNITIEEYNKLYIDQDGKCFLCDIHSSKLSKPLTVDHCHSTGKIRSLLCFNCNTAIGQFKENIEVMQKAILYLKKHQFNIA